MSCWTIATNSCLCEYRLAELEDIHFQIESQAKPSVQCVVWRAVGVSIWGLIDSETAKAGEMIEDRPGEGTILVEGNRLLPSLSFSLTRIKWRQRQETGFLYCRLFKRLSN